MSGGSFNYLEHWFTRHSLPYEELEEMHKYVSDLLVARGDRDSEEITALYSAASHLYELIEEARKFEAHFSSLAPVMHAVEWRVSNDWGEEKMLEKLVKWLRRENKR